MPSDGFEPDIIKVNAVQAFPRCCGVPSDWQCPGSFLSRNCSSCVLEMCMGMRSQHSLLQPQLLFECLSWEPKADTLKLTYTVINLP